jgi:tRNA (guanine37-N1)-methyltransferase
MLNFTVITIFPQMLDSALGHSILKIAQEKKLISVEQVDLRQFTSDRHHVTDDYPYGGGQGMIMKPEPLVAAIEAARQKHRAARVVLLAPQGRALTQQIAQQLAAEESIVLVCGRYEGIDERVKAFIDDEISVGDYTLSGGEPAANVVIDAVTRLIPGVLGNENSPLDESFSHGLLEYPQYTRPEVFRGMKVPDVLLSGDHQRIKQWRHDRSVELTRARRPDLLPPEVSAEEIKIDAGAPKSVVYIALLHYPVYDRNHQVVTTAVTNMDIHDISRSSRTYGVRGFYVVTPVKALQKLALKIIDHWETGFGSQYNVTRKQALEVARIANSLDDAIIDIERECGEKPVIVVTSARPIGKRTSFTELRDMLHKKARPILIILGTGWGLTETIFSQSDYVLEALEGYTDYNHLSVRSAAAIILDRLMGRQG